MCQTKQARHFACICSVLLRVDDLPRITAAAPFVGKNRRAKVQCGVLLCGVGYLRESASEGPLVRVVPVPRANRRRPMVKHWCRAQWIARVDDFLGIQARAGAGNQRFIG
jgi:hypothetical protein